MNKIAIDNSTLPFFITEELYVVERQFKEKKIETEDQLTSQEDDESNAVLPALDQKLLVIVRFHDPNQQIGPFKVFLTKLLAASGYKLSSVDVVVMNKFKEIKAKTIINHSSADFVMTFGVDLRNPENFSLRQFNGKQVIIAAPLELLPSSRDRKSKLWSLMKEMFRLQ